MDEKLKLAIDKMKSAMAEVEACMSQDDSGEQDPEQQPKLDTVGMGEDAAAMDAKPADDSKKKLVMSLMKKKGY
jgi:hypothetical protein